MRTTMIPRTLTWMMSNDADYVDYQSSENEDDNLYNGLLFYDDDDANLDSLEGGKYRVR